MFALVGFVLLLPFVMAIELVKMSGRAIYLLTRKS
jgi:hypothetical protein